MKRIGRHRIVLVAVVVLAATVLPSCPSPQQTVVFKDRALESAVRNELGLPLGFLSEADLLRVHQLDCRGLAIWDLKGLEKCRNLYWLDASQNNVSNLNPLSGLTNLTFLGLSDNHIVDISPLAGLFNLDELILTGNEVWDIGPLVDNARAGGLGYGDTVRLDYDNFYDDDDNTSPTTAAQFAELAAYGVEVQLAEQQ